MLRRQVGDALDVAGEGVGLAEGAELWIDVREFERLAGSDAAVALELCRGDLLEGLEDDWAVAARDRHRDRVIELLERLASDAEERGEARDAIELTRRQVERDRFDEEAHRRLIERLDGAGDRAGAMRTYRTLAERLRRELGVAPSRQTRELVERLRAATPAVPMAGVRPAAPGLLGLIGRERELTELESTWEAVSAGTGAAAVIRGEAGIGKTRLATELRSRVEASGGLTAVSAALDLGGMAPLSLWAELVRELLPALAAPGAEAAWPDDLAVLSAELPAHFARGVGHSGAVAPDLQRTRLYEAVVALLDWAARQAPVLLVLEDVHAADGPSLELAAYAARRVAGLRVMMLITRRELPSSTDADRLEHALRARGSAGMRARARAARPRAGGDAGARGGPFERGRRQARRGARRRQRATRGRDRASARPGPGGRGAQRARIGAGNGRSPARRSSEPGGDRRSGGAADRGRRTRPPSP